MAIQEMSFWKWLGLLLVSLLLALLLYGVASMTELITHPWLQAMACVAMAGAMIVLYSRFVPVFEGAPARDVPMNTLGGHLGEGFGIGVAFFVLVTGIMMLVGCYRFDGWSSNYTGILRGLFFMLIVAVGEEIVFRGVLFRWIDEKWGFPVALGVSALVFGLVHWTNPGGTLWSGIAIAIEAGLLLGAAYKWSGTLWHPIGIHWAWNFTQGNIFGFAVSGNEVTDSLLLSRVEGPLWLTGDAFGPEGSVIAVALGALVSAWFISQISQSNH